MFVFMCVHVQCMFVLYTYIVYHYAWIYNVLLCNGSTIGTMIMILYVHVHLYILYINFMYLYMYMYMCT